MWNVSLQKPAAVQFSPKAKNKEAVVGIWRYMTVADVANAIGKSVGKCSAFIQSVEVLLKVELYFLLLPVSCVCHEQALVSLPLVTPVMIQQSIFFLKECVYFQQVGMIARCSVTTYGKHHFA